MPRPVGSGLKRRAVIKGTNKIIVTAAPTIRTRVDPDERLVALSPTS